MKTFQKPISEIIIHCTATPAGRDLHVPDITRYHIQRGFETIGYHHLITLSGKIEPGRAEQFIGAHCLGHNRHSIGVVYVGGLDTHGRPADTRTPSQRTALHALITDLSIRYPGATIHGHNEFAAKACPCFNVATEFAHINNPAKPSQHKAETRYE